MSTNLVLRADQQSLWLCFEPWATEYTALPGTTIVIRFHNETPVEVAHHRDGMTFFTLGRHPDLYAEDGTPVEIYSEYLPETPKGVPISGFRFIMEAVPPVRSEPDRLN
ncbi:hypothetical protein FKR81_35545 [Lentzea tibetensis]|uniref:Uncharacterized protein n=1 Tax=Lentzea tibetensis TaxID=2591470 RepID=A0A563EIG4_9PSEU|nr:hypothetical protein [Lentzea tibetensis]TWP46481.1 hypothetical protein FKR81_35545 [Lentzea tibetensis]